MNTAFDVDWHAPPAAVIAAVAGHGERLETPCGDGNMIWHRWSAPPTGTASPVHRPPLVLLHGGWGSWTHWIKAIPALAARTTVLVADIPGMGDSGDVGRPDTIEPIARILADGIDQLLPDGAPYDIAGFSFGGVAGVNVAALHGARCRSFTAVGAAGFGDLHYIVGGIQVPDPRLPDAEINAIHHNNLKHLMLADEAAIDPLAIHIHRANIERGRVRSRRISLSTSLVDTLSHLKARIGGIWGDADVTGNGLASIEKRRDLFRNHQSDCPFDILEGGGHWIMYEKPDAFTATLCRHLDVHEAAASDLFAQ